MISAADRPAVTSNTNRIDPFARALIATDASRAADGAMCIGRAMQERDRTATSVVSVVEPIPYPSPVNDLALAPSAVPSHDEELIRTRVQTVIAQCDRLGMPVPDDLLVSCSVPLSSILFQATLRKSELIILGLGRHRAMDRFFGTETALQAVRETDVATLAVPGSMTTIPHRAIVGTDFDASSLAAARAAARLVGPRGHLTLVHVDPLVDPLPAMLADWPPHVLDRLNEAFERVLAELGLPETMRVDTLSLAGHVATELLACASRVEADVIAVGRHSRSLVERVVLGSTTTRVIRSAECAVMVVPRDP
jgi:nucleotide-binding universal stress UspA family protein